MVALQRGNSISAIKAPSRCVSIRTPLEPIEGGSVLDGIRPGRRCHLDLGLPWKVWWPYTNIRSRLRTERGELGLSLRCLSQGSLVSLIVGAPRGAQREIPLTSGGLASRAALAL